jgi:hypothetical protein
VHESSVSPRQISKLATFIWLQSINVKKPPAKRIGQLPIEVRAREKSQAQGKSLHCFNRDRMSVEPDEG